MRPGPGGREAVAHARCRVGRLGEAGAAKFARSLSDPIESWSSTDDARQPSWCLSVGWGQPAWVPGVGWRVGGLGVGSWGVGRCRVGGLGRQV